MALTITTFIDYENEIKDQFKIPETLKLEKIAVRRLNQKPLFELDLDTLNEFYKKVSQFNVVLYDPLLPNYNLSVQTEVDDFDSKFQKVLEIAKKLKTNVLVYDLPTTKSYETDKTLIIEQIKKHLKLAKKSKVTLVIRPQDNYQTHDYRDILETIHDDKLKIIFDPLYLYQKEEAAIAYIRILRNYIGIFIVDDKDPIAPRFITTSGFIPLKDLFKRFKTNKFDGIICLNSSLMDMLYQAKNYKKLELMLSKKKRHEVKILNSYLIEYENVDTIHIIKEQLKLLNIEFMKK